MDVWHVHVGEYNSQTKLERNVTCMLLGISEESKAYELYNPIDKKIIISWDVVSEEQTHWRTFSFPQGSFK